MLGNRAFLRVLPPLPGGEMGTISEATYSGKYDFKTKLTI